MKFLTILSAFILISQITFAQEIEETTHRVRLTLFGGVSIPQSDFASTSSTKAGFASTGFAGGLEVNSQLNPDVSWITTLSLSANPLNTDEMQKQAGSGITISGGSYLTTWGMTGARLSATTPSGAVLYCQAQAGLLYSSFPDIELNILANNIKQTTTSNASFAGGFGAGILLQNVNIGLRYFTGTPEYEQKAVVFGQTNTAKVNLPATVLLLIVGVSL